MSQSEWEAFLLHINITSEGNVKLATEAALFASLIANGIPKELGVHGDDAGQFNVFVRSLCWIHEERYYRKLIPSDDATRQAIEQVRILQRILDNRPVFFFTKDDTNCRIFIFKTNSLIQH